MKRNSLVFALLFAAVFLWLPSSAVQAQTVSLQNPTSTYFGTSTQRTAFATGQIGAGKSVVWYETNTGCWYQWTGSTWAGMQAVAGEDCTRDLLNNAPGPWTPEEVAASATDQSLGTNGSTGDYLHHCQCQVITSGATGTCGIEDGTNTAYDNITVVPASTPIGTYPIIVNSLATTAAGWEATTGAGATMQCYGKFDVGGD